MALVIIISGHKILIGFWLFHMEHLGCWLIGAISIGIALVAGLVIGRRSCPKDFDKYPVDDCSWPSGDHDSCDPEGDEQQSMKLVMLVRTDIKMTRGKACAQCSHAAVRACQVAHRYAPQKLRAWLSQGQKKITLKVTEQELSSLLDKLHQTDIICGRIQDAGHTQVDPGTVTVGFVGPWDEAELDKITGHLKLY